MADDNVSTACPISSSHLNLEYERQLDRLQLLVIIWQKIVGGEFLAVIRPSLESSILQDAGRNRGRGALSTESRQQTALVRYERCTHASLSKVESVSVCVSS